MAPARNTIIIPGPTLSVKMRAISPITALPWTSLGNNHTAASNMKMQTRMNEITWPARKSHSPILNQRRQYSWAWEDNLDVSTARSSLLLLKASNRAAMPCASISSRIRPMPAFLALPHSDACSDTSIPVGSSPRNEAMISQDPSGVSSWKKCTNSLTGAGFTTYTPRLQTMRIPAAILVTSSTAAYFPPRMMATEVTPSSSPYRESSRSSPNPGMSHPRYCLKK